MKTDLYTKVVLTVIAAALIIIVFRGWDNQPLLCKVMIRTSKKRYSIHCSYQEAWECRKKKQHPSIWALHRELSLRTGLSVYYVTNQ